MAAALNYLPQVLEEVQSTGSAVNRILDNFPHYTLHTSVSDSQAMPDDTHNPISQIDRNDAYPRNRDHLQLQMAYTVAQCRSNCPCECHNTLFSWMSGPLAPIFGRARFQSTGPLVPSWIRASRHIRSCKASAVSHTQIIYFLPAWFAMKAIYIRYTSSPSHSPEWLIKIPRLVNKRNSRAFQSMIIGDFPGFKSAIASGECTPYDVDEDGRSLISVSVLINPLQGSEMNGLFV